MDIKDAEVEKSIGNIPNIVGHEEIEVSDRETFR